MEHEKIYLPCFLNENIKIYEKVCPFMMTGIYRVNALIEL